MKQFRKFIIMTIMLMMGSVCMAEEAKKDSIWGLEMSDVDTEGYISLSFYTNIDRERVKGIDGEFFCNNKLTNYFYTNTLYSKENVVCEYIKKNNSIYKIILRNVNFYKLNDKFMIWIDLENKVKSNVLYWYKGDKTAYEKIDFKINEMFSNYFYNENNLENL